MDSKNDCYDTSNGGQHLRPAPVVLLERAELRVFRTHEAGKKSRRHDYTSPNCKFQLQNTLYS